MEYEKRHLVFRSRQFDPEYTEPVEPMQISSWIKHNYRELTNMLSLEIKQAKLDRRLREIK
jgi:hypothetical protein